MDLFLIRIIMIIGMEKRWKFSNIYSLSIGQGELLVTPLQMANFASILANRGFYYDPSLILEIDGKPISNPKKILYK